MDKINNINNIKEGKYCLKYSVLSAFPGTILRKKILPNNVHLLLQRLGSPIPYIFLSNLLTDICITQTNWLGIISRRKNRIIWEFYQPYVSLGSGLLVDTFMRLWFMKIPSQYQLIRPLRNHTKSNSLKNTLNSCLKIRYCITNITCYVMINTKLKNI